MRERRQARRGGFRGHITDAWSSGFAFNQHLLYALFPGPVSVQRPFFQRQPTNASWSHGTARHSIQRDTSQPPAGCKTSRPNSSASCGLLCTACSLIPYQQLHDFYPHKRAVAARFCVDLDRVLQLADGCKSKGSPASGQLEGDC